MARWFSKGRFHYPEPQRYTPSIARARRLNALLEQDRRFADLPNFTNVKSALSEAPKVKVITKKNNDLTAAGHKAALIAAALSKYTEKDFSDPVKRQRYRQLRQAQEAIRSGGQNRGGQKKVSVPGGDKRQYNPTGKSFAARTNGVIASIINSPVNWVRVFANPTSVIPCIQRNVRREVMFAKGRAGKGYRTKKRRTWQSGVPC